MNAIVPGTKRRRRVLPWAASLVGAVVLAEFACRVDALFPTQPFDSTRALAFFTLRQEAGADQTLAQYTAPDPGGLESSVRPVPHPYFGWTSERDTRVVEEEGRWFADEASRASFDVLVFGGSVAAEFGNRAGERLASQLGADARLAGRPVRVWNDAHAGHKAPQTGNLLAWILALGHAPDAIILVDGFNEVAIGLTNARAGAHPLLPSNEFWTPLARGKYVDAVSLDRLVELHGAQRNEQAVARTAVRFGFHRSALLSRITLARLKGRHQDFVDAVGRYLEATRPRADDPSTRGPWFDAAPAAVVETVARGWTENARTFATACRARGIVLVHCLQPTLYDPGSKPMTSEERRFAEAASTWKEGVELGYPRLRAALLELSGDDVPVHDATRIFERESESMYVDVCHLNERGNEVLADFVSARLLEKLP